MTIAASLSDTGFKDVNTHMELAAENICAMCAPSSAYASALFDVASVYSGGHEAPHVKLMDTVAKGFGCNVSLGGSLWDALAKTSFQAKTTMFPLVRISLAIASMTSDKIEAGAAKLLARADVTKVASKSKSIESLAAEEPVKECLEAAEALGGYMVLVKSVG